MVGSGQKSNKVYSRCLLFYCRNAIMKAPDRKEGKYAGQYRPVAK
ncbi:hypothetical protein T05_2597 [Trichinella murrelli]|uniref:Uncharacterized protein n=1 Tax=Trichinella murrelli TaxID=144512 RepID=A0A0V0SRS6_9BILA|nr:hypothetical protein T05_2597 [Trichinella murrelli]